MKDQSESDAGYDWFARADLRAYRGKYVAIVGRRVAAAAATAGKAYARAQRKFPGREIMLAKVPKEDIVFF